MSAFQKLPPASHEAAPLSALRSIADLAFICGIDEKALRALSENVANNYRHWNKRKKNGKLRPISAPSKRLKVVLKRLSRYLVETCSLPQFLHGGVRGKSPKTNASIHLGQRNLLNLDLRDYYPSISKSRVVELLEKHGAGSEIAEFVSRLVSLKDGLPQGAPTSSILCNLAFEVADARILKLCRRNKLKYTRFVDDLSISGERELGDLRGPILSIIKDCGFSAATEKTQVLPQHKPQVVTGVQVNAVLNVPRLWRKELRDLILECHTRGPREIATRIKTSLQKLRQHVYGKISYLRSINRKEARRLRRLACNIDWVMGNPTPIGFSPSRQET